jgi:histone H3/H4
MTVLDVLDVEKIIRKAGAERVSEEAGFKLSEVLEEKALAIAERAIRIARYAHKRTITRKDIELALMYENDAGNGPMPPASAIAPEFENSKPERMEKRASKASRPKPLPLAI